MFQAAGSLLGQFPSSDTPRLIASGSTDLQLAEPGTCIVYDLSQSARASAQ